jgi:GNAT superfamily N-acetyltransferase
MRISVPKLEDGRIYGRTEVEQYIGTQSGTSDFDVMASHFPRNLQTWEHNPRGWRPDEEILLQYQVLPISVFEGQLLKLDEEFSRNEDHRKRVEAIVSCLLDGARVYPVFLQENDFERRIIEGMHRSVALHRLNSRCLPAFLTGYQNWFVPDGTMAGFEQEDEIIRTSIHDAFRFFGDAIRYDHKGADIALLSGERIRQCDEAFIAKFRGRSIGAVTMAVAKGSPTLSTVYVLSPFRRKRVASRLCECALFRFKEAGVQDVFCDVQPGGMVAVLKLLGHSSPELRALLNVRSGK